MQALTSPLIAAVISAGLCAQATEGSIIQAAPGSAITVRIGPNERSLSIVDNSTGASTTIAVVPGKDTQVQIPNVPGGTILSIEIGKGPNKQVVVVEVIAPGP